MATVPQRPGAIPYDIQSSRYGHYYNDYARSGHYHDGYSRPGYAFENQNLQSSFVQFGENYLKDSFSNIENVVQAICSISALMEGTYTAMINSFRTIMSVTENLGKANNTFGQVCHAINIFRLFGRLYARFRQLLGFKKLYMGEAEIAWNEVMAAGGLTQTNKGRFPWEALVFFGSLLVIPYFISKFFFSKFINTTDPNKWKVPGQKSVAKFNFKAAAGNEMSVKVNDRVMVAPTYIQDEMKLANSEWYFAVCNNKSGIVPKNYLLFVNSYDDIKKNGNDDAVKRSENGENKNQASKISVEIKKDFKVNGSPK